MGMPALSHAPDRTRLLIIAERCYEKRIGPILASPFFTNLADDKKVNEFNARMSCFCQALSLNDVKPMFITENRQDQDRIFAMLHSNGSYAWSIFLHSDHCGRTKLSSLALATGMDRANEIFYPRAIVEKVHDYFSSHQSFLLAGSKEKVGIVLPGLESYLARAGMTGKTILVEDYLAYP